MIARTSHDFFGVAALIMRSITYYKMQTQIYTFTYMAPIFKNQVIRTLLICVLSS